jgi:hypothetical protein
VLQNAQLLKVTEIIIIYINLIFSTEEIEVTGLTIMGTCTGEVRISKLSKLPTAILTSTYPSDIHDPLTSTSNIRTHFPNTFIFTLKIKVAGPTSKVHINL